MEQPSTKNLPLFWAVFPILLLMGLLAYNVLKIYQDNATYGANQFALFTIGFIALGIGVIYKIPVKIMLEQVYDNIKTTSGAILILLMVGSLAGTWLISGIIPTMIYYGLQIINPTIFLAISVIISALVSVVTGSSWSTSATIGIALMGIGKGLGIQEGMIAGAVISGAYFGDKISPMSDTTNLAAAVANSGLFNHIRYMLYTTIPSITITLIIFIFLGIFQHSNTQIEHSHILTGIKESFNIHPLLMLIPVFVIVLIIKKVEPLLALFIGTILGGVAAILFQPDVLHNLVQSQNALTFNDSYKAVMNAIVDKVEITTSDPILNDLLKSRGMSGMLSTVWLILAAMFFGGIMEAIGALDSISNAMLKLTKGDFGVFASTTATCVVFNGTVSDQYLSIVVPGKMYAKAFQEKELDPVNLSRTLEDSGTVTSVLFPWNTCGAYNAGVLNVATAHYLPFAFFNIISPFMTLIYAFFNIKIKRLVKNIQS